MLGQQRFQRIGDEAVTIHWRADNAQAVVGEDAQRQEIGGLLHEHHVARMGKDRTDHVQRLRDAIGDHQPICGYPRGVFGGQECSERAAHPWPALFGAILERVAVIQRKAVLSRLREQFLGQEAEAGVAEAQINHAGRHPVLGCRHGLGLSGGRQSLMGSGQ